MFYITQISVARKVGLDTLAIEFLNFSKLEYINSEWSFSSAKIENTRNARDTDHYILLAVHAFVVTTSIAQSNFPFELVESSNVVVVQ